jgi:ATP-dependent DNA helicase Q4
MKRKHEEVSEAQKSKKKKIKNIISNYESSKNQISIQEMKKISEFDKNSNLKLKVELETKVDKEKEIPLPPNAFSLNKTAPNFSKEKKKALKENLKELTFSLENKIEIKDKTSSDESEEEKTKISFKDTPNYVATNLKRKFKRFKKISSKTPKNVLSLKNLQDLMSSSDEEKGNEKENFSDEGMVEDCDSSESSEDSLEDSEEVISGDEFSMEVEEVVSSSNFESFVSDDQEMNKVLKSKFGFDSFQLGQQETIKRIISGKSTLLIQATGSGKSLCYQYPAYILPNLTLVITPLISLMNDQLLLLPNCLQGACLNNSQTTSQKKKIYENIKNGSIKILFISPERLNSDRFIEMVLKEFPPISFACIDEVHCVSQWSHNFRPSYLHLKNLLQDKLKIKTILGLTATATYFTQVSICELLNIPPNGVIRTKLSRSNLNLSISKVNDKYQEIVKLLNSDRFKKCSSVIIYVMMRVFFEN